MDRTKQKYNDFVEVLYSWAHEMFGSEDANKALGSIKNTARLFDSRLKKLRRNENVELYYNIPKFGEKRWARRSGSGFIMVDTTNSIITKLQNGIGLESLPVQKRLVYLRKWLTERYRELPTVEDMVRSGNIAPPSPNVYSSGSVFSKGICDPLTIFEKPDRSQRVYVEEKPLVIRQNLNFDRSEPKSGFFDKVQSFARVYSALRNSLGFNV